MTDVVDETLEMERALSSMEFDEENPTQQLYKPNPRLLSGILGTTFTVLEDMPEADSSIVLFQAAKQFVQQTTIGVPPDQVVPAIFTYYIEAYRSFHAIRKNQNNEDTSSDPQHQLLYNEAALSIFDLYLATPSDALIRRLVPLSAQALQQIVSTFQSSVRDRSTKEVFSDLSTIAMLTLSVNDYLKGSTRRTSNLKYIEWLAKLYRRLLSTHDISFLKDDTTLRHVVPQVINKKRVIELNEIVS